MYTLLKSPPGTGDVARPACGTEPAYLDSLDRLLFMKWQLQEAKQRFSELIRTARTDGAQVVTRHGEDVAVVLDIDEYLKITGAATDFKTYLRSAPDLDSLEIRRAGSVARSIDLAADE